MNARDALRTPTDILVGRRQAALRALGRGVLVLPAAPLQYRSRDGEHRYHPDRELFYLTGATEPETVAVLSGGDEPSYQLFVRERDPDAELWAGPRLGPEGVAEQLSPDACHSLAELEEHLPTLLHAADRIFFRLGRSDALEAHVLEALRWARGRGSRTGGGPRAVVDPGEILDDLRVVKDEHERGLLRQAAALSVEGQRAAAAAVAPGAGEWAVEAELDRALRARGARGAAFETIVGSGANACVLHYVENACIIGQDDLVLVDAGAEHGLYHGDVTRTYPAAGRFTGAQREVYEVVDAARRAGVDAVRPGASIGDVHAAATRAVVEGLVSLGAVRGDVDALIEEQAHKPFYPHQTSHWLGLDVHDVGDYAKDGVSRALEPGMVFTVEPGLYFRADHEGTPERLAGIGVRIEDDVVVTERGCEVLTGGLPTAVDDVEALVRSSR
ncbi:MAG TPA: aminopeptidase P N-terminal domain-containing protein [Longimicrobiales bacterium]|nr:aminopeptidase P N-terminal domain-containing protein [Longimicrobiales bacterium]